MTFTKNEIRVGLFILVPMVILLLFILLKLGYSIAGSTMDVFMKTDSITSIKEGTPIKIKGYPLGRVVDIKPVYKPSLYFLATLRLKKDVELYEECTALIQNQNIIGDPVIEFRNPEKRGKLLREGDVIEGLEVVNLEATLAKVNALLTNLNSTAEVLKEISTDNRHSLKTMVYNLSSSVSNLSSLLANSQKDIGAILGSFRETAKTMNEVSIELKKHPLKFLFQGKN